MGDGEGGGSGDEKETKKRIMRRTAKKRKSPIAKVRANVIKFCEILDHLPINFRFKLNNLSKDFNGSWEKTALNGTIAWQNGPRILFNSSFFLKRKQVFEAIEEAGYPVGQLYFPDKRSKIVPRLTKEKLEELYHGEKKSLGEIAKQYGCSKQNIMGLMERLGLKRRTPSQGRIEAIKQGRG